MDATKNQNGPLMLSFDVTYKCTLKCLHCFNLSNEQNFESELTDEEMINVCQNQILPVQPSVVCFCGGEPLLRKEILYQCCSLLIRKSNKNISVNMVTNGELLTKEVARDLERAGFTLIQVSLDGSGPASHDWLRNKKGAFSRAIEAIKNLKETGLKVAVAFTPTLKNINEAEDALKICEELGVHSFRVQPLMPMGRAVKELQPYIPKYEEYRNLANFINRTQFIQIANNKTKVEWGDPVDHLIRQRYRAGGYAPFIGINAYGYITISPYLPLTVGNVKKHTLSQYWENGLAEVWKIGIVREISSLVKSCGRLGFNNHNHQKIPKTYLEKGISIDLIDQPGIYPEMRWQTT